MLLTTKRILIVLSFLFCINTVKAQITLTQQTLSSCSWMQDTVLIPGFNNDTLSYFSVSYTLGQPFTATIANGGQTVTQGPLQVDPPRIFSFSPAIGNPYDTILITGTVFTGTTGVNFGITAANYFKVLNDSTIVAVVGNGSSGPVWIVTPVGNAYLDGFTFNNQPAISSITPLSGPVGSLITITGTNLFDTTVVKMNNVNALRISSNRTSMVVLVMQGTTLGPNKIWLSNGGNYANNIPVFSVTPTPHPITQQGNKLVGNDGSVDGLQQQGYSVAISADGNTAIVGGSQDSLGLGAAWIYTRTGSNWIPQGSKLTPYSITHNYSETSPGFGSSVALSADGNTAIIGGPNDSSGVGSSWIFTRMGNTWTEQARLIGNDGTGFPNQGISVGLSADGRTAIIGGYNDNNTQGAAWIFTRNDSVWSQVGSKLFGNDNIGSAQQGYAVALSADAKTAIVGGNFDNGGNGASWIYKFDGTNWYQQGSKLTDAGSTNSNQGSAVALNADGTTAIVGGPYDNGQIGASWIYTFDGSNWSQQGKLIGKAAVGLSQQG